MQTESAQLNSAQLSLRERKKQQTRQAIAAAAFEMFADRGFDAVLVRTVREREPGRSVLAAVSGFLLEQRGLLGAGDRESHARLVTVNRIIADSPSLLARERQIYDRYTRTLAALIAEQRGVDSDDTESWVVANAIVGVHRGLVEYVRRNALAGRTGSSLARRVRAEAERALAVLGRGLAGYPDGQ
jgi:AcrR family transcriptional regulator